MTLWIFFSKATETQRGRVTEANNLRTRISRISRMRTDTVDTFFMFNLNLTMSAYMDLMIERNGDIILVGHYREENGDLISDLVLAMEGKEIRSPVRIELWCGDTICAFYKDGKRMIYPDRMKEFRAFRRRFARNIREQRWLENGGA